MKKLIFIPFILLLVNTTFAQYDEEKFVRLEQPAEYPGGSGAFMTFIYKNLQYPQYAVDNGIEGEVHVMFVIDETGKLLHESIEIVKSVHDSLDNEVIRIIKLSQDWKPGRITKGGETAKQRNQIPVRFDLESHLEWIEKQEKKARKKEKKKKK